MSSLNEHELWQWRHFLERLDKAGYAVVKKPGLRDVGVPHVGPIVQKKESTSTD